MDKVLKYRHLQSVKQVTVVLVALLLAGCFAACQKDGDGIYSPDKKLSKLYIEEWDALIPKWVSEKELTAIIEKPS